MENESTLKVLEYKLNDYAYGYEDFKVPCELMVNITLSEYRTLVKSDAVSRAEIDRHKKDAETYKEIADKLNKENVLLKGQLQAVIKDENRIKFEILREVFNEVLNSDNLSEAIHTLKNKMEVYKDE